ncbi:hypothetical protein [Streptomyces canus]|nr:hypothetical protein [Streptomyces canus]
MHARRVNPIGNTGTGRPVLEGPALRPAGAAKPPVFRVRVGWLMPARLS